MVDATQEPSPENTRRITIELPSETVAALESKARGQSLEEYIQSIAHRSIKVEPKHRQAPPADGGTVTESSAKTRRVVSFDELNESGELMKAIQTGSGLVCALVVGAHIENALGSILQKAMVADSKSEDVLNNPKSLLSSAGARADAAFCFGLISEQVHFNAKRIADVRNRFAHSHLSIDFNDDIVKGHCQALRIPTVISKKRKGGVASSLFRTFLRGHLAGGPRSRAA